MIMLRAGLPINSRIASRKIGSSWFLVKVTSKMKLSLGIQLDVVID